MLEIIAEIGVNHTGNFNIAWELIRSAKQHGADTVKFQLYNSHKLFGNDSRQKYEFSRSEISELKQYCDDLDIEFLASVFDEDRLKWLEDIGVKRYKIASRTTKEDIELCKLIAETRKPIIISDSFTKHDVNPKPPLQFPNAKWLHCVYKYPTLPKHIDDYKFRFNKDYVGWSDHYLGIAAALHAISQGATIIEKHFTLNRMCLDSRDHIGSMDPNQLLQLRQLGDELYYLRTQTPGQND